MTLNDICDGPYTAHCACQMCCVCHVASSPPLPCTCTGRGLPKTAGCGSRCLRPNIVTFFVTKAGGWGGSGPDPHPPLYPSLELARDVRALRCAASGPPVSPRGGPQGRAPHNRKRSSRRAMAALPESKALLVQRCGSPSSAPSPQRPLFATCRSKSCKCPPQDPHVLR